MAQLRAVLAGHPDALAHHAAALGAARDEAVARLAFETAQQVHDELAAVAWLVAPQRVTGCSPAEFIVAGWADGVLVRFAAHAGRLDTWQVERRATPPKVSIVPGWEEFATVNAELAARLVRAQAGGRST